MCNYDLFKSENEMEKILISACLLGEKVRYDGNAISISEKILDQWSVDGRIIPVCPEVDAGMTIPRAPAEISNGDGNDVLEDNALVFENEGNNVTGYFRIGADIALSLCKKHDVKIALLTENSPSCGSSLIYDGTFKGIKKAGIGVTTALLQENGIQVFNQFSILEANKALQNITRK